MPFLKIGNQVYQGQVTPLIGDEVILELKRGTSPVKSTKLLGRG